MKNVCIIGLGWLGKKAGIYLQSKGIKVTGTCRSEEKKIELIKEFDAVRLFDILEMNHFDFSQDFITEPNYFLITIPPSNIENYPALAISLMDRIVAENPEATFIFTSSTSVYGNESRIVNELSKVQPESENAEKIVAVENYLLNELKSKSVILRLGGLVGDQRHPVKYLAGKEDVKKPNAPINLIHFMEINHLLHLLITQNVNDSVLNVCTPEHPTKKDYYQWAAKRLGLTPPTFKNDDHSTDKTVISPALSKMNFKFKFMTPFDYPELNEN